MNEIGIETELRAKFDKSTKIVLEKVPTKPPILPTSPFVFRKRIVDDESQFQFFVLVLYDTKAHGKFRQIERETILSSRLVDKISLYGIEFDEPCYVGIAKPAHDIYIPPGLFVFGMDEPISEDDKQIYVMNVFDGIMVRLSSSNPSLQRAEIRMYTHLFVFAFSSRPTEEQEMFLELESKFIELAGGSQQVRDRHLSNIRKTFPVYKKLFDQCEDNNLRSFVEEIVPRVLVAASIIKNQ